MRGGAECKRETTSEAREACQLGSLWRTNRQWHKVVIASSGQWHRTMGVIDQASQRLGETENNQRHCLCIQRSTTKQARRSLPAWSTMHGTYHQTVSQAHQTCVAARAGPLMTLWSVSRDRACCIRRRVSVFICAERAKEKRTHATRDFGKRMRVMARPARFGQRLPSLPRLKARRWARFPRRYTLGLTCVNSTPTRYTGACLCDEP